MKILTICFILISIISWSQVAFKEGEFYGYRMGEEVLIPAQFDYVADFTDGYGCVKSNGKWGFIDADKNWLFEPLYDKAGPFVDGYAKVKKNGKLGLVHSSGKQVLANEYDQITIDWNGIVPIQSEKRGLFQPDFPIVPCKYTRVGKNGSYLFGETENGKFDIYSRDGLLLVEQDHSFSSWSINKDSCTIAKLNGKYGLYDVTRNNWMLQPEFGFIQKLRTEEYYEYDADDNQQKYSFVYAVFKSKPESTKDLDERTSGKYSIDLLKASSLVKVFESIGGYQQVTTGYGYNKEYDYKLTLQNGSEIMLNQALGVIEKPVETKIYGFTISSTSQKAELWEGDELLVSAKSIEQFYYNQTVFVENGEKQVQNPLNNALLLIRSESGYRIYSLKIRGFLTDEMPLSTTFNCGFSELEFSDFYIKYMDGDLEGICVSEYEATPMQYEWIEGLGIWGLLKFRNSSDELMSLAYADDMEDILFKADDYCAKQFGGGDYFIQIALNGKVGVYSPNPEATKIEYDELIDIGSPEIFGYRIGDKYGCDLIKTPINTGAQFDELTGIEEVTFYPYGFIKNEKGWIGLDGNFYLQKAMIVPIEDEAGWGLGWENWRDGIDDDIPDHQFISTARYEEVREAEIYPNFRVKGKNGMWGMINNYCDTLVPIAFSDIGYADLDISWDQLLPYEEVVTAYTKKGGAIYSTVNGILLPDGYDYSEPDYDILDWNIKAIRISKKKLEGYYILGVGEKIPPLYKSLNHAYDLGWEADTLIARNKSGLYGFLGIMGDTVLPFAYTDLRYFEGESCYQYLRYPLISLVNGKKEGVYNAKANKVLVPAVFDMILADEVYYDDELYEDVMLNGFVTKLKKNYGFYDYHGNELLPSIFDEIKAARCGYDYGSDILIYGELDGKIYINYSSAVDSSKALPFNELNYFDQLIGNTGIRFDPDGLYAYDFISATTTKGSSELTVLGESYDIYIKNGKYGAKDKNGNMLVEPIYENGNFMGSRTDVMIGFENGIKYYIYVSNNERYSEDEW